MRDNPKRRCDGHQRSERALTLVPDTGVNPFVHRVRLRCRREAWLGPVMQHEQYCCTLQLDSRVICLSTLLLGGTEGAALMDKRHVAKTFLACAHQPAARAGSFAWTIHQHRAAYVGGCTPCSGRRSKRDTAGPPICRNDRCGTERGARPRCALEPDFP